MSHPALIAYDGSDGSKHAIDTAAGLLGQGPALILHVWSGAAALGYAPHGVVGGTDVSSHLDRASAEHAKDLAEEGRNYAEAVGFDAKAVIRQHARHGAWKTIVDTSEEEDAAVVVMGARGRSGVKAVLLGSVSTAVAQHSPCPVMIVPPPA